jgi:cytochrome bd ubiquinol oxidase subunit II
MVDLWYVLVCAVFAAYVVLDGYDLGAGIVSPFVAKNDREKKIVLHTILPFWDGNEVFLVAGGATLYLAFPRLFPAFVSGFYLPVMMVLWLLAGRGLGIEMRHKLDQPLWNQLWDGVFFFSSAILVLVFGAALGNVVRGVSVDEHGVFFAPLWTDFTVGEKVGILDWYTVLIGLTAVVMIARHGALRLVARLSDDSEEEKPVRDRSAKLAQNLFPIACVVALAATIATFAIQPNIVKSLAGRPWTGVFGLLAFGGLIASFVLAKKNPEHGFRASSAALVGFFGCAVIGVHPYGVIARIPERSILATDAAADSYSLSVGLAWWLPGMALVVAYTLFAHRLTSLTSHASRATIKSDGRSAQSTTGGSEGAGGAGKQSSG